MVVLESEGGCIYEAAGEVAVFVDAAVAEEGPPLADGLCSLHVNIYDGCFFIRRAGLIEELSLLASYEAASPELDAARRAARVGLKADAIDCDDRYAVGYGVAALDGGPGIALPLLFLRRVRALVTDGGGVDEEVGSLQGHEPRPFGIPLVPADLHAKLA